VPLFDHRAPLLANTVAGPQNGTSAATCCAFGDVPDVSWWHKYDMKNRYLRRIEKKGTGPSRGSDITVQHLPCGTVLPAVRYYLRVKRIHLWTRPSNNQVGR
jgi:hypothetical protein